MSARYYSSAGLRLKIGKSRIRTALHAALGLLVALALALVWARGFHTLAIILLPAAGLLLSGLARDPAVGAELSWRLGTWSIYREGQWQVIFPAGRTTLTPWVICLGYSLRPGGHLSWMWIYADTVPLKELRQLRVRLVLHQ